MLTTFHAAQAAGSDWQTVGRRLREQLPQPCHGGIGLLWGTPPLHDDLASLALMLRSITKVSLWSPVTVDGVTGITSGQKGAAVLVLPYAPPDAVLDTDNADPGVVLLHHSGRDGDAATRRLMTTQDFVLGALSGTPESSGNSSYVRFGPAVAIASGVTQSCLPVGPIHAVTRTRGTHIITIDDAPAQQILRREIGADMLQTHADWRDRIFVGLPERGHDRDDYRTIAIAGLETDGGIVLDDPVETGRRILFTARSAAGAAHDLRRMLHTALARCPTPRGALYYTTPSRRELFPDEGGEHAHLRAALDPKIPFIGLHAAGIVSGRRTHRDAGLLVLFG